MLRDDAKRVLDYLRDSPPSGYVGIARALKLSRTNTVEALVSLMGRGAICRRRVNPRNIMSPFIYSKEQ